MAPSESNVPNPYVYHDRLLLSQHNERNNDVHQYQLSQMKGALHNPDPSPDLPICIIGAGTAGLYTAMILESLGISYQIVDADTRERVGGRLFTYHFSGGRPYDYFVCWTPVFSHRVLIFVHRMLELCGSQIGHS